MRYLRSQFGMRDEVVARRIQNCINTKQSNRRRHPADKIPAKTSFEAADKPEVKDRKPLTCMVRYSMRLVAGRENIFVLRVSHILYPMKSLAGQIRPHYQDGDESVQSGASKDT
jgi:hypothetical protein